jgi:hypothetical protein
VLSVVALPVEGNKYRLHVQDGSSKPVVAGPRLARGNPLPFYDFGPRDLATAAKDAKRLQAYIDREHEVRYVE